MAGVSTEVRDHVAAIRLCRQEKLNAIGSAWNDGRVRCVVLAGSEGNFCVGVNSHARLFWSADHHEAAAAYFEKRPPTFTGN